jgi:ABC-type glycerol-3-phosphate transport system substrate-binding protein
LIGWLNGSQAFVADGAKECSEVPNLTLNAQILDNTSAGEQARLGLSTASEGNPSPYEIVHGSVGRFTEYASSGWLYPIDDLIEKYREEYNLDDIPQAFWDAASYEGKHYGVPFMGNAQIFYYRTDLLEKHNIKVPATWDEVIAACEVLKQEPDLEAQFTMTLNAGWAWSLNYLGIYQSPGNKLLNEDNTPAFTSDEGVKALNKMLEIINTCTGEAGLTYSTDDSEIGMETGRVAMSLMYATRGSYMDDPNKSSFVGKVGFAPAPAAVPGGMYGSSADFDFLLMPKHSAVDHDLVFQVILNATDRETLEKGASGALVTRQSVPSTLRFAPATLEAMANAVPDADGNPAWNMASTALGNWLPKAATGMPPQEVLDGAAAEYTQAAKAAGYIK